MERIVAARLESDLDADGLPLGSAWEKARPVVFCADWHGENPDPLRETQARFLWANTFLFVGFRCRFRSLYVYPGSDGRRDALWQRDVAEVFIRSGRDDARHYREFEISPNGDWLDLEIRNGEKSILFADLKTRVRVDTAASIWFAEMAIPFACLTAELRTEETFRLNLFRIEGPEPDRFYSAWRPTYTDRPDFHVPERFGELALAPA